MQASEEAKQCSVAMSDVDESGAVGGGDGDGGVELGMMMVMVRG